MDAAVTEIGDREAYVDGPRRLTFAAWVAAADGVGSMLLDRGVGKGDVVALRLENGLEYAIAYAAVVRIGAVATGINGRLGEREVDAIVDRCRPVVVLDDAQEIETAASDATSPRRAAVALHDPACIIWTSGTTGVPKGAWFDHAGLRAAVESAGVMTMRGDRRLTGLPFAHAGYMSKLWEQFAMGVTQVLSPMPWTAESMLEVLQHERITVAGAVPTQWAKLLEVSGIGDVDFSELRLGLAATAPASPELIEAVRSTIGCPLVVRYAMTESPSITGTDVDDPPEVQYRTVGRPQEGISVDIVDDDGTVVAPGAVGRVRIAGSCVMRGYWNDPERTAEVLDGERRLTSSDLGSFDSAGNLVLAGRADDMYIRGGYNVYPVEVENVLAEHPGVARSAVVGIDAPVIGQIGVAVVVPVSPTEPPTLEALRSWVGERLADYKRPDRLEIVDDLPLTPMLKVDVRELRRRFSPPG
jgi:acyl-CoA synthetase (AMP-forming)/AMP-acid ligase II